MDSPRQQAAQSYGWWVGGIVRERLISKAPARASERYHYNQQSKLRRVRVESFRTSFFIYEFICDAGVLKLTRGIIVIVGEKGKCHQALSNKNAGMVLRMIFSRATAASFRLNGKDRLTTGGTGITRMKKRYNNPAFSLPRDPHAPVVDPAQAIEIRSKTDEGKPRLPLISSHQSGTIRN